MAEEQDDPAEKTEDPTQHRIDEFRKRGEVSSSKELTSVLLLATSIFVLGLSLLFIFETLSEFVLYIYTLKLETAFTEPVFKKIAEKTITAAITCVGPVFLSSIVISILSNISQFGFLWAPEVLEVKFERINPIKGFTKLLSIKSAIEALKAVFKFVIILSIVYMFMGKHIDSFSGFLHLEFAQAFFYGKSLIVSLSFFILLGIFVLAVADFTYQKISYLNKMKLTKEQAKREHKEQDGNPEIKQRIRSLQREAAQRRMMQDVPKADVIITNPTHISVALKYDPKGMVSPQVIAKGADFLALRIREIAKENKIPLVENVPLARTLYKTVKVGSSVPRNIYKAVAEVLAFVYKLKKKRKALG